MNSNRQLQHNKHNWFLAPQIFLVLSPFLFNFHKTSLNSNMCWFRYPVSYVWNHLTKIGLSLMMWLTVPASDVSSLSQGPPAHPKQYYCLSLPIRPPKSWNPKKVAGLIPSRTQKNQARTSLVPAQYDRDPMWPITNKKGRKINLNNLWRTLTGGK